MRITASLLFLYFLNITAFAFEDATSTRNPPSYAVILAPSSAKKPFIHGPKIFGVRPKSPFLYTAPATGDRPMTYTADGLPSGLQLDEATGQITGSLKEAGTFAVTLRASNALGKADRPFKIVVGDDIALLTFP